MTSRSPAGRPLHGKTAQVALLALAETLAMGLWFSASAVVPQLTADWAMLRLRRLPEAERMASGNR